MVMIVLVLHIELAVVEGLRLPVVASGVVGVSTVRLHPVEILLLGCVDLGACSRTLGESVQPVKLILGDAKDVLHDRPCDTFCAGWVGKRAIVHPEALFLTERPEHQAHVDLCLGVGIGVETIVVASYEALDPVVLCTATDRLVKEDTHDGLIAIGVITIDLSLSIVVLAVDGVLGGRVPLHTHRVVSLLSSSRICPLDSGSISPGLIEIKIIVDFHVRRIFVAGGHRVGAQLCDVDFQLVTLGDLVLGCEQVDWRLLFASSADIATRGPILTTLSVVEPSNGRGFGSKDRGSESSSYKCAHSN